jgi:hypothetical protein
MTSPSPSRLLPNDRSRNTKSCSERDNADPDEKEKLHGSRDERTKFLQGNARACPRRCIGYVRLSREPVDPCTCRGGSNPIRLSAVDVESLFDESVQEWRPVVKRLGPTLCTGHPTADEHWLPTSTRRSPFAFCACYGSGWTTHSSSRLAAEE